MEPVTQAQFNDGLGYPGKELLRLGLNGLLKDVESVLGVLQSSTFGDN